MMYARSLRHKVSVVGYYAIKEIIIPSEKVVSFFITDFDLLSIFKYIFFLCTKMNEKHNSVVKINLPC